MPMTMISDNAVTKNVEWSKIKLIEMQGQAFHG